MGGLIEHPREQSGIKNNNIDHACLFWIKFQISEVKKQGFMNSW